jgi:tetratricopeptide (TPR) repeat protein
MSQPEKDDSTQKEDLTRRRGEYGEEEERKLTSHAIPAGQNTTNSSPIPDVDHFLQQRLETNETVASLIERTVSSLEPALRTPAYCYLARSHADRGRWSEARRWCQRAIAEDNLAAEAYYLLALVSQHEGDLEGAITNLKRVIYLGQEGPVVHFNLALLYRQQGEAVQARRSLNNAVKMLDKWPAERPMPYGDGIEVQRLLATARSLLREYEGQ